PVPRVVTHRNRAVMVSWFPGRELRIHEGYAHAPDSVLSAIVRFLSRRIRRETRLAARQEFLSFPVEDHAPPVAPPPGPEATAPAGRPAPRPGSHRPGRPGAGEILHRPPREPQPGAFRRSSEPDPDPDLPSNEAPAG